MCNDTSPPQKLGFTFILLCFSFLVHTPIFFPGPDGKVGLSFQYRTIILIEFQFGQIGAEPTLFGSGRDFICNFVAFQYHSAIHYQDNLFFFSTHLICLGEAVSLVISD